MTQWEPGLSWRWSIQTPTALKVLLSPRNGPHRCDGVRLDKNRKGADEQSPLGCFTKQTTRPHTSRPCRRWWTELPQRRGRRGGQWGWSSSEPPCLFGAEADNSEPGWPWEQWSTNAYHFNLNIRPASPSMTEVSPEDWMASLWVDAHGAH